MPYLRKISAENLGGKSQRKIFWSGGKNGYRKIWFMENMERKK